MKTNYLLNKITNLLSPYKNLPKEIYIIFISKIINALGCFVMPLLTLILTDKVGLSNDRAGFLLGIAGVIFIPASVIGGKLADTIGRKTVILTFEGIAAFLYIVCGFLQPSMILVYILMLSSFFMVAAGPAHDSLLADLTTPENRNGAYSLCYMGWNIGFAVGPIIGGFLFNKHLPLVFIGDASTTIIALFLFSIFIKETIHLTKENIQDATRKNEKQETGSIFKVLLKRPILIYFSIALLGYNFIYSQWSFMMPLHTKQNFGAIGARYYGSLASFNGLVVMLFTPFVTKMLDKTKDIRKIVYGGILYTLGFGILGFISKLPIFFLSVLIFTLGEIVVTIAYSPFIANHTPMSHRGRMSAVLSVIMGFGFTLGPIVMGKALMFISLSKGWIIIGIIGIVSSVLMLLLEFYDKRTNIEKDEELVENA